MNHGHDVYKHQQPHQMDHDEMLMDESFDQGEYGVGYPEEDELQLPDGVPQPRAVHQCNICNKIFVSFKGLQQHSVIHTDQKPFQCDICAKAFRFKSNLFEHRSVHTGFTPHACPFCGKTCRLKGNLKKHLKTHVSTKEELEEVWRPFASNRRPPADIPEDAIILRGNGEPFFTPPSRPRKRKMGLGSDARPWIDKIRKGEILPGVSIDEKLRKLMDSFKDAVLLDPRHSFDEILNLARNIPFERFDCPFCKGAYMSRGECYEHIETEHQAGRMERPLFCDTCLKAFADKKSLEQHESYHKRVHLMIEHSEIEVTEPEILLPTGTDMDDSQAQVHHGMIHQDFLAAS